MQTDSHIFTAVQLRSQGISSAPHRNELSYRADVDGLRGIAVLAVLGFHAGIARMKGGFVGVDVFFVISGFLISSILFKQLNEGRFSLRAFYERRIRRILPALILVLSATWIYGWVALLPEEFKQLSRHIAAGAGFASNLLVANGAGYFDQTANSKPLLHLWSLGIEEQYYLFWPCIVAFLWKARIAMRLPVIVTLAIASFSLNALMVNSFPVAAYYMPQTRFWELMIGASLAYTQMFSRTERDGSQSLLWMRPCLPWLGIALIAFSIGSFDSNTVFPGFAALFPTIGAALLISSDRAAWFNRIILSSRALVGVGLISYPLYLWHWPIISALSISEVHPPKLLTICAAFILAFLTYQFVEKPIREQNLGRRMVPILLGCMVAVACTGLVTVIGNGLPKRLPTEVQGLMNYHEEEHLSGWRTTKCFLNQDQDYSAFVPECVDKGPNGTPLVLLWGDSHAADLYPGIRYLEETSRFRLAQFTSSSCPPIVGLDQPTRAFCRGINDYVISRIHELKPETVIMAGQFELYGRTITAANITATVAMLRHAGVRQVLFVGPNPEWHPSEPRLVLMKTQSGIGHKVPERLAEPLASRSFASDSNLKLMTSASGASYLSPVSVLCDSTGCLTKVSESGQTDLLSFDTNHLTTVGSRYIARQLFNQYLR